MRRARATAAAWGLGACAASVALVAAAQTEPSRVTLQWVAPVGCPDEAAVRDDVQRLLSGSQASGTARADVTHGGDSWRVVVAMNGGERKLEAASCRALAEATALIVAMAVDPARVVANRASQSASVQDAGGPPDAGSPALAVAPTVTPDAGAAAVVAPTAPPTASATTPPPPPADATPPPSSPVPPSPRFKPTVIAASASFTSDFGSLPTAGVGPSAAFAWTPGRFRIEIGGAYFFPSSTPSATLFGYGSAYARFTLLTGALRACWSLRAGSFEAGPCVEGEVAALHGAGEGQGYAFVPTSGTNVWFAPGGELFGAWRFTRHVGLIARADALIPTTRNNFQVDGTPRHTPGTVTARLSLGVELRF